MAFPDLQYFSALSLIPKDFRKRKEVTEHKMCVLIFSTNLSEAFLNLKRTERDMVKKVYWSSCNVAVILVSY